MSAPPFPHLEILALDKLLAHEWYDDQRTLPLVNRILQNGVFRNPPIVTPTLDHSGCYVVLDGANRTAALKKMGCPHVLAQVVEHDHPGLRLRTWNHILLNISTQYLVENLRSLANLDLVSSEDEDIQLPARHEIGVALVQTSDQKVYALSTPTVSLSGRVTALNAVVDSYKTKAVLDRTTFTEIHQLAGLYTNLSALVIFPKFNIQDLVQAASAGCLLPPGITRTTITPRALYLNLPLHELTSDKPITEKNAALQKLIQERAARGQVTYCEEDTFMFDE